MNILNKNLAVLQLLFGLVCTVQTYSDDDVYAHDVWKVLAVLMYTATILMYGATLAWPRMHVNKQHTDVSLVLSMWFVFVLLLSDVTFVLKFRHMLNTQSIANVLVGTFILMQ